MDQLCITWPTAEKLSGGKKYDRVLMVEPKVISYCVCSSKEEKVINGK